MFIGIDPSINSTGIVIRLCDKSLREKWSKYYILKGDTHEITKKTNRPKSPLSKAELEAQKRYDNFNYILYDKIPIEAKATSIENEHAKTASFISLIDRLIKLVSLEWQNAAAPAAPNTYVVIEGISYGSTIKTSSVFDLAGLNYMIRTAMMKFGSNLIIAPPSHVKKFATGLGNANKDLMIETFKSIHPEFDIPKIDDIADAFFMSRLAQLYYEQDKF